MYNIFNQFNQQDFEPRCTDCDQRFRHLRQSEICKTYVPCHEGSRAAAMCPSKQTIWIHWILGWGCWFWDAFCDPKKHHSIIKSCTDRERRIVSYSTLLTIFFPECMCNILNLCAFALLAFWPGTFPAFWVQKAILRFQVTIQNPLATVRLDGGQPMWAMVNQNFQSLHLIALVDSGCQIWHWEVRIYGT